MIIKKAAALLLGFLLTFSFAFGQLAYEKSFISIGVVVEDIEASVQFYTESLGMIKTGGFTVTGEASKRTGLSDGIPFDVVVLKLHDDPNAAEWKLLSFDKKATHPTQKFIQDDNGMQYITLFVKSLKPFVERLEKNSIELLGETPTQLGDGRYFVLVQDPDGTFIELIGPME
jgi:catechol 2,3-dioxygenase-like lactoylglutathione lyase family enzyme